MHHELKESYLPAGKSACLGFGMVQGLLWEVRCSRSHPFSFLWKPMTLETVQLLLEAVTAHSVAADEAAKSSATF